MSEGLEVCLNKVMDIFIFQLAVLLFSVVIHEVSHGFVAEWLGDPTARMAGRLTLNPIKHLDLFGSFIVPFLLFITQSPIVLGWAKPVPYNPNLLIKDYKYGPLKVALAGPASNLILAVVIGLTVRFAFPILPAVTVSLLGFMVFINILLAVFNLVPIPPLDGSKILTILLPPRYSFALQRIGLSGIFLVLLFLFFFSGVIFGLTSLLFGLIVGPSVASAFLNFL